VIRFEIQGEDGQWHEVPGVTSVELHPEAPAEPPTDAFWRRHDALDSLVFMTTAVEEARQPRVIDQDGNPVRPYTDRPGPSPRRY
jgi:hypothetical protein